MSITARCDDCGKGYRVGDDKAGRSFTCRECGSPVQVPGGADDFDDDFGAPPRRRSGSGSLPPTRRSGGKKKAAAPSGPNPMIFVGAGVALLLVVGLVVGGIYVFSGDDTPPANAVAQNSTGADDTAGQSAAPPAPPTGAVGGTASADDSAGNTEGTSAPTEELTDGITAETSPAGNNGGVGSPTEFTFAPVSSGSTDLNAYIPQNALGLLSVQPSRMLKSPLLESLPIDEMMQSLLKEAARQGAHSDDPRKVKRYTIILSAPTKMPEQPPENPLEFLTVVAEYHEPIDPASMVEPEMIRAMGAQQLGADIDVTTEVAEYGGKSYTRLKILGDVPGTAGAGNFSSCLFRPSPNMLVITGEEQLKKTIDAGGSSSPLASRIDPSDLERDLFLGFTLESHRELLTDLQNEAQQGAAGELPPGASMAMGMSSQFNYAALMLDLTGPNLLTVQVDGVGEAEAEQFEQMARGGQQLLNQKYAEMKPAFSGQAPPEALKLADAFVAGLTINRDATRVTADLKTPDGLAPAIATLLLPAIQQARNAARRSSTMNNLKQIALAVHNYHDVHRTFPIANGAKGQQLSWRVHLLPFLEHGPLYNEFHMDEPWDSPHNKMLIERMPSVYASPDGRDEPGKTRILSFRGNGALFGSENPRKFRDITDGMSNTLLAIQAPAEKAVVWTKPEDIAFDPMNVMAAIGTFSSDEVPVVFTDGAARPIRTDLSADTWKAMITIAGGETVDARSLAANRPGGPGGMSGPPIGMIPPPGVGGPGSINPGIPEPGAVGPGPGDPVAADPGLQANPDGGGPASKGIEVTVEDGRQAVKGTVSLGGAPVENATIIFWRAVNGRPVQVATGRVRRGKFTASARGDRAPSPSVYGVSIVGEGVPRSYANPTQSGLIANIERGENTLDVQLEAGGGNAGQGGPGGM